MRVRRPEWIGSQLSLLSALGRSGVARDLYQLVVGIPRTHPPFQPPWSVVAASNPYLVTIISFPFTSVGDVPPVACMRGPAVVSAGNFALDNTYTFLALGV